MAEVSKEASGKGRAGLGLDLGLRHNSRLLFRKHGQRTQHVVKVARECCGFSANATVLAVLPCLFTHGLCQAASSSEGADGRPVMSGVTRPQFQNTAVNKVKVSPFCWKEGLFL